MASVRSLLSRHGHTKLFEKLKTHQFQRSISFRSSSVHRTNLPTSKSQILSLITVRGFQSNAVTSTSKLFQQSNYRRLFITSASVVGSLVLLDGFLNRDQRTQPLSTAEKELLNSSFQHTGVGLAVTATLARYMFRNGLTHRMMAMNPLLVVGAGLAGSIGTMLLTLNTNPENTLPKYGFWLGFSACQAATLSPLYFFAPAILSRAALYTVGVVGSLSYVGATAKNDKFLYMGGPLLAGVSVVALSSLAPLVLPVTAARTLMATEAISLYGGLAVFSGFVLYDTQKILHHGRLVQQGRMKPDPVNESVGLIMNSINIFIRLVQILGMQSSRNRR
ncbi:inhibitor of apoptosis-promoting Bax1-domain-containing protein [Phakopsora pachyrhizi]|uniref:Inhibitor of apoptosis-promoting Bax1-domain-containing protein n=1 Tax=Phakopsora pachyrhizi TaxID=170000 RepID=A0AAV0B765_PHAPC|nr:inhibitor of apoptosis-promoting Bax1-domain-containing protein [Phakopsora pachyrhizi]CAH7681248.1 inhibitor of apoptosis-promoting Bax1-domain-containing protein [Phakopsora pachyrhizi]